MYQAKFNISMNHPFIHDISIRMTQNDVKIISEMAGKEKNEQTNENYQKMLESAESLRQVFEAHVKEE